MTAVNAAAIMIACLSRHVPGLPATLHAQGLPHYTATQDLLIDGEKANLVPIGSLVINDVVGNPTLRDA